MCVCYNVICVYDISILLTDADIQVDILNDTVIVDEGDGTVQVTIRRTGQLAVPLDVVCYVDTAGNSRMKNTVKLTVLGDPTSPVPVRFSAIGFIMAHSK